VLEGKGMELMHYEMASFLGIKRHWLDRQCPMRQSIPAVISILRRIIDSPGYPMTPAAAAFVGTRDGYIIVAKGKRCRSGKRRSHTDCKTKFLVIHLIQKKRIRYWCSSAAYT
jgi:hypothetical protein